MESEAQYKSKKDRKSDHNFLTSIRPIIVLSYVASLAPAVVTRDDSGKHTANFSFRTTASCYILSFFLYTITIVLVNEYEEKSKTHITILYFYGRIFISFMINITILKNRHLILTGLKLATHLEVPLPKRYSKLVLAFALATSFFIVVTVFAPHIPPLVKVTYILDDYLPMITVMTICSQFGCQVAALRIAISKFNKKLSDIFSERQNTEPDFIPLRKLMSEHNKLWAVCSILNEAYGIPMLLATSAIFCEATYCIFFICKCIREHLEVRFIVFRTIWAVVNMTPPVAVLHMCQQTETMSKETRLICKRIIPTRFQVHMRKDDDEYGEFELQLDHQKIRFTAFSCFDLNGSEIKTVTATIITYVVILLQNG